MSGRKFTDLTGQKFGRLYVLEMVRLPNKVKNLYCKCQCDCGKISYVKSFPLIHSKITSCGCKPKYFDLTGQKFNFLTVLGIGEKPKDYKANHTFWICRCNCGKEVCVDQRALKSGNTKSCGCYKDTVCLENLKRGRENRVLLKNRFEICDEFVKFYTKNNTEFLVDTDDFENVFSHYWKEVKGYIVTKSKNRAGFVFLHRFLLGENSIPKGMQVDHINRIKTDNKRKNLRIVTQQENSMNRPLTPKSKCGFLNIHYRVSKNKYEASFIFKNKKYWVGTFDDPKIASEAIIKKRKELGGLLYEQRVSN